MKTVSNKSKSISNWLWVNLLYWMNHGKGPVGTASHHWSIINPGCQQLSSRFTLLISTNSFRSASCIKNSHFITWSISIENSGSFAGALGVLNPLALQPFVLKITNYLLLLYRESKGRLNDFEGKYFTKGSRDSIGFQDPIKSRGPEVKYFHLKSFNLLLLSLLSSNM